MSQTTPVIVEVKWDSTHAGITVRDGCVCLDNRPAWKVTRWQEGCGKFSSWMTERFEYEMPEEVPLAGRLALRLQQQSLIGITRQQAACCYAAAEALEEP